MIVSVFQPARPYADLADITAKEILRRGWETDADGTEQYVIQYAVNLTAAEEAAVRRRLTTGSAVEETLHAAGLAALTTDRTFRDNAAPQLASGADAIIAAPTLTQANMRSLAQGVKVLANQVDALTRQNIGLIRLAQRLLDAAD